MAATERVAAPAAPQARRSARISGMLLAAFVCIAAAVVLGLAANGANGLLFAASVVSIALYCLLYGVLFHYSPRFLSISNLFGIIWLVFIPVRLMTIQADRKAIWLHPAVVAASDDELAIIWLLTTLGFAAFVAGVVIVHRRRTSGRGSSLRRPPKPTPNLTRSDFLLITVAGLGAAWLFQFAGLQGGIINDVAIVYLFGLAGLGFLDTQQRRWSWLVPLLVGAAMILGVIGGSKLSAMLPVIAWALGAALGGFRVSILRLVVAGVLLLVAFTVVQGIRLADRYGTSGGIVQSTRAALFDYNLATSRPEDQGGLVGAGENLLTGVLDRASGADAMFVVRSKTPDIIPYQNGATIWQPAASVVPGADGVLDLNFQELSLGRYFAQQFWSARPAEDLSSQAITLPGDFYLNFGVVGIAVGMLGIGVLAGFIDRRFPPTNAFGAGVLAYVGTAFVSVESNVAYAVMTAGIRLAVIFALIGLIEIGTRNRRREPADGVGLDLGSGARPTLPA